MWTRRGSGSRGRRGAGRGMRTEMEAVRFGVWAAVPRCVQAGGSEAGRGGSGRCFYQHGFEMDREATARYVSSPVSADTTLSPPRLPPGQHKCLLEEMPFQRGWGHPGPRAPSSRSHPSTPRLTVAKPFTRQDLALYKTGFSPLQATFLPVFCAPYLKPRAPNARGAPGQAAPTPQPCTHQLPAPRRHRCH